MPRIISIGYGRNFFVSGNIERERMKQCASGTKDLHMVIFTRYRDGLAKDVVSDRLTLYPTASRTRIEMVIDAFRIARSIILKQKGEKWIVTTQDPFETALVGFLLKSLYGVSVVVQEHGDFFDHPYWRKESVLNQLRYVFGLYTLKHATRVRVVSKRQQFKLAKRGITNVSVVPVAIDRTRYNDVDGVSESVFPSDSFVFLSVARFVPQKNLTSLIMAFRGVHQLYPHVRLVLVGRGSDESVLKRLLERWYGTDEWPVTILPWSDDVPGLMKESDVYVLSSYYEGWARVLVEAMVSHLPIVTTDVGCAGEVVQDGIHGLIVPVADTISLEAAMKRMVQDTTFYASCKANQKMCKDIPGTTLETYSQDWLKTFESLE